MNDLKEVKERVWDFIIVGTGMGGASLGYKLANENKSILFIEKGNAIGNETLKGNFAEKFLDKEHNIKEIYKRALRESESIIDFYSKGKKDFIPLIGSGSGGSTTIYGLVLNRFYPEDFNSTKNSPVEWPIKYEDLKKYYAQAEKIFNVVGEIDPLREKYLEKIREKDKLDNTYLSRILTDHLKSKGLHPFMPPLGYDEKKNCGKCQCYVCKHNCKNDAYKVFIEPILNKKNVKFIYECEAKRLIEKEGKVYSVVCNYNGERIEFKAKNFVLAANALQTPKILLSSKSKRSPKGLANSSGLVGRNLTRKLNKILFLFPKVNAKITGSKEIYVNDFYEEKNGKLGIIQSFGEIPPASLMVKGLLDDLMHSRFNFLTPIFKLFKPLISKLFYLRFKNAYAFILTTEDKPSLNNRIFLNSKNQIVLQYKVSKSDSYRSKTLAKKITSFLRSKKWSIQIFNYVNNNRTFLATAAGTCKMGNDPKNSVVNKYNCCHDVPNLYIVDSSFYPTNPAQNTGLTLAANSFRVADYIIYKDKSNSNYRKNGKSIPKASK